MSRIILILQNFTWMKTKKAATGNTFLFIFIGCFIGENEKQQVSNILKDVIMELPR